MTNIAALGHSTIWTCMIIMALNYYIYIYIYIWVWYIYIYTWQWSMGILPTQNSFFWGLFNPLISGPAPHSSITYRNYIYYIHLYHHWWIFVIMIDHGYIMVYSWPTQHSGLFGAFRAAPKLVIGSLVLHHIVKNQLHELHILYPLIYTISIYIIIDYIYIYMYLSVIAPAPHSSPWSR